MNVKNSDAVMPPKIIQVSMLGGFSLTAGGHVLTDEINRSLKLWNVLAYLIMHQDRDVSQAELIEQFWPDDSSSSPANALKTLLYRIRAMLEPFFPPQVAPILSHRGGYGWNTEMKCQLDVYEFESCCLRAGAQTLAPEQRKALYRRAMDLYRGDFFPKLAGSLWVASISIRYHTLYLAAVEEYAQLLEADGEYEAVEALARTAEEIDPLDEGIYVLMVRALLRQGKDAAALAHYENATDLLYRNLGVRPSEELRALYQEIMAVEKGMETDLEVIQHDLQETAARTGAFFCEYGFFREAYRLEARRSSRTGACVHVALLTVSLPDGGVPPLKVLNATMDDLLAVLLTCLRRGDVLSKYSAAQYVVMLPAANFENSTMVLDRVVSTFFQQHRRNFLKISTRIREVELT